MRVKISTESGRHFELAGERVWPVNEAWYDEARQVRKDSIAYPASVGYLAANGNHRVAYAHEIYEVKPLQLKPSPTAVFVCSPLRAPTPEGIQANIDRAKGYCMQVLEAGCLPYAPHVLLPQFLDELNPTHRAVALEVGLSELRLRQELWFWGYPTDGMLREIKLALQLGKRVRMFDSENPTQYLGDLKSIAPDGALTVKRELVFPAPEDFTRHPDSPRGLAA